MEYMAEDSVGNLDVGTQQLLQNASKLKMTYELKEPKLAKMGIQSNTENSQCLKAKHWKEKLLV